MSDRDQGPYSQHFIFSVTYESAQLVRVLHYTRLKRLSNDKHSSLLGTFINFEGNEVLRIWPSFLA